MSEPYDPFRPLNRRIHGFNMALDRAVLGPAAHTYVRVVPVPVRQGIGAALDNLKEPRIALNDLAQGHVRRTATAATRFVVNSTVGLLGLFDVADRIGLPAHSADFGQTMGRYGLAPGPYLVLPVFGPANVRDALGRVVDTLVDPVNILLFGGLTSPEGATRFVAQGLDDRVYLDPAMRSLADATDPYATMRSAYLQRRAAVVRQATGEAEILPDFDTEPRPDDIEGRPDAPVPLAPGPGAEARPPAPAPTGDPWPAGLAFVPGPAGGGPAGRPEGP
jgi:phospholipid-binding lipoprotein MlaA